MLIFTSRWGTLKNNANNEKEITDNRKKEIGKDEDEDKEVKNRGIWKQCQRLKKKTKKTNDINEKTKTFWKIALNFEDGVSLDAAENV